MCDHQLVSDLFFPEDVTRVLSTPSDLRTKDSFIWGYSNDVCYSMKSGSWLLSQPLSGTFSLDSVEEKRLKSLKARVWKLQTRPKICMFIWRSLSGALGVSE